MYIIYRPADNFTNMVLLVLSMTFFGDIHKFVNGIRNIKNINAFWSNVTPV